MKSKIIQDAVKAELPGDLKAEEGKPLVINLAPFGEFPQDVADADAPGGTVRVVQVVDGVAVDNLIANFKDKVLVDADHSSETSSDTKAMAWVTRLFRDEKLGLMAEIEPTSIGAESINGRVYRFVSAAWTLDGDNRPDALVSVGLTNKPNLPVSPIINSVGGGGHAGGEGKTPAVTQVGAAGGHLDGGGGAKPKPNENQQGEHMDINEVKTLLGIPADATDEDVKNAIEAVLEKCKGLEEVQAALGLEPTATNAEVKECLNAVLADCERLQAKDKANEEARLNAEAEKLVAENEDVIPEEDAEAVKARYVADPEAAKEAVANMRRVYERAILNAARKPEATRQPVVNFKQGRKPVVANMESALAACGGDPERENAVLRSMAAK